MGPVVTALHGIRSVNMPYIWPDVTGLVEVALDHHEGSLTLDSVHKNLADAKQQLWVVTSPDAIEAIVITEIVGGVCVIVLTAGKDRKQWTGHIGRIEAWAAAQSCHAVEYLGRNGWEREPALKDYKRIAVLMRKELDREQLAA